MAKDLGNRLVGCALVAVTASSFPILGRTEALGADQASAPSTLSEVVVTAQKRVERLQDVPVSVSAIQGPTLEQLQATQLADWAGYVPGLNAVSQGAPGETFVALDGVAPIAAASEVGLYVNDTPVGSSSSFQGGNGFTLDLMPYDLDRLEVLRGPQGTLYGASTMGGLIKYVLAAPDLTRFSGRVGGDVFGVQNAGSTGGGARGEVNLPLIQDRLAIRVSGYDENTPGYIDDAATGRRADNPLRQTGGRVALLWRPRDDLSVELDAIYQDSHADNQSIVALDFVTGEPSHGALSDINTLPEPYTQKLELYDATVKWNLHWAELTSMTSYQSFANDTVDDFTGYLGPYLGLFGAATSDFHEDYRLGKFTQELRLASPAGQRLTWLAGAFFTHETGVNDEVISGYEPGGADVPGVNPLEFADLPSEYKEYAFFGNGTYHFNDWFDLAAGVRYAHNTQTFVEREGGGLLNPADPVTPVLTVPGSSAEGVTTYSVSPSVHLSKDTMLYARVATGYQPGGPNLVQPGVTGLPAQFNSSRLTDYQLGLKSTFLDERASVDLSAFYIDWSKIQVSVLIRDQSSIENAGSARSEGLDLSARYSPLADLTIGANLTYTDAILTRSVPSIGAADGARLPYIPLWAGALTVDYAHPLGASWQAFAGGGWRYVGARYSDVESSTSNGELQGYPVKAYGDLDLHFGARTQALTLKLFVKNLADKRAYLAPSNYIYDITGAPADIKAPVLQPRTAGLSIDYSF
ncbi:MAG TPA: TonB-dependent receptor [Steroidobacteraceae bacterium]|jgi:outer membrane receptor protein involved in Fe transport|nr:TonB-dependent receptor [Steroidobacteraceae bacterium]